MPVRLVSLLVAAMLMILTGGPAYAGLLASLGGRWHSFAFDNSDEGVSPNYYGLGGQGKFGYSIDQVFDIAAFLDYTPATLKNVEGFVEDAVLYGYGGELALRVGGAFYIAARGGSFTYNLINREKPDDEVDGKWTGTGFGGSIGALFENDKRKNPTFWQVSLDAARVEMDEEDPAPLLDGEKAQTRKLDSFSVTLTYVFNGKGTGIRSIFMGDFLKSIGY